MADSTAGTRGGRPRTLAFGSGTAGAGERRDQKECKIVLPDVSTGVEPPRAADGWAGIRAGRRRLADALGMHGRRAQALLHWCTRMDILRGDWVGGRRERMHTARG